MIQILIVAIAATVPASGPPTYDEQAQQCAAIVRQPPYPLGTAGFASAYESCRTLETEALKRETGSLIAQGRCADAISLALRAGQLQMAADIRAYCSVPQR